MIIVRSIDLLAGRTVVGDMGRATASWQADLERLTELARSLGLREVLVHDHEARPRVVFPGAQGDLPDGDVRVDRVPQDANGQPPVSTAVKPYLIQHRCAIVEGLPVYDGSFLHEAGCLPHVSRYCALLLSTYGEQITHLMQLRLALYEICANVVEHGLRHRPGHIDIHLHFRDDSIQGWVQDNCKRFDPSEVLVSPLPVSVAARKPRGYGIHIIRQLLDGLGHEYNDTGNRITFNKRIAR